MLAIITVLVLPPKESYNNLVSFESLYGIKLVLLSIRALMTLPKVVND